MSRILCIEDDQNIRELILYTLRTMGFEADGVGSGEQMWKALEERKPALPDLILMDIMLPGDDGTQLLKGLKKKDVYCEIPVIMLTAKGSEADKVQSLDYGADDYITKPFGMMELVSRIRAVLRRCTRQETMVGQILRIQDIVMDDLRHKVTVEGRELVLTLKEYQLLHTFMNHPDIVFTRNQLLDDLWGHEYMGESRTLDVHIATLRQKLGDTGKCIETVRGVGYRMRSQP